MNCSNEIKNTVLSVKRNINQLSPAEINQIIAYAPNCCYSEIAEDLDVPVNTVKKVVRQHNHARLRRYK